METGRNDQTLRGLRNFKIINDKQMVNEKKHVVVDRKQINISKSVNQHIKTQRIVLNQLANVTRLNKIFKLVSRLSKKSLNCLEENLSLEELNVASFEKSAKKVP